MSSYICTTEYYTPSYQLFFKMNECVKKVVYLNVIIQRFLNGVQQMYTMIKKEVSACKLLYQTVRKSPFMCRL